MTPRAISNGRSFKALSRYLHTDRAGNDRALWSSMENIGSDNPETAAKVMAFTALHADEIKAATGHRKTKPTTKGAVYHAMISWAEGQTPTHEHQLEAARGLLKALGMESAQAMLVAQNDNGKEHVHIMVNLVDPNTGKRFSVHKDGEAMSAWALAYEKANGGVLIEKRERNAKARAEGRPTEKSEPKRPRHIDKRAKGAANDAWTQRRAERDAAFARQQIERAEMRAAHSAEWKAAKAEAAQFKAAYKGAIQAAYQRHKAADKIANKPRWKEFFRQQEANRRSIDYALTNGRAQADYARAQAKKAAQAVKVAERRAGKTLGRLAQRFGLALTPEQARAGQQLAAQRMTAAAGALASAELARAATAQREAAERKALAKRLSDLTYAKAQADVANMPRADFSPMIAHQNAAIAEQIKDHNAERAALGMKPYEPRKAGAPTVSPLEKMAEQNGKTSNQFAASTDRRKPVIANVPPVQGAGPAFTYGGLGMGKTPAAPDKAKREQIEQAKAQAEQAQGNFSLNDMHRRRAGDVPLTFTPTAEKALSPFEKAAARAKEKAEQAKRDAPAQSPTQTRGGPSDDNGPSM